VTGGLLARVFVLFHDLTHGSFFESRRANQITGWLLGVLCWTPYENWRHNHLIHHASSSDLDRRVADEMMPVTMAKLAHSTGGVLTLTVEEYCQSTRWERMMYRAYRHPMFLFAVLPMFVFVVFQRTASAGASTLARRNVWFTNAALLIYCLALVALVGLGPFLLVQTPIMVVASTLGMWLFYVQHQFEDTYWVDREDWDFTQAALVGSSFYKLPRILQWFTASIGFHHVHHLSPRIPNYRLQECHESASFFSRVPPITLGQSFKSLSLRLWDEERQKLVTFEEALR
jgi:omega-6 fatty acid desaturase (delta-12 desaturase)